VTLRAAGDLYGNVSVTARAGIFGMWC